MTAADRAARSEHGDGPVERCPKCGDAGVVVDPQKHAEWHARGAPGLALGIDAGDGPVLGEREQYLYGFLTGLAHLHPQPEAAATLVDELFALLVQARADGAAEERERIGGEIADRQHAERAGTIPPAGSADKAYEYARRIVQGES